MILLMIKAYTKKKNICKDRINKISMMLAQSVYRPQEVVIFIVGGTTYEESRSVAQLNASNSGIRFILGGTAVLNSKRFLKDLEEAQGIARSNANVV
ncbi:vacuolar protein sorting-associated protein 45-like protein isoform X1 [Gossypium australe]|uniref:Vacuolar protein sorting-associated protein 45-like protein isoform X1 n=1 Tax=Gossypium australe TaxID=47621 RepID=A0A5B6UJQ5_9ROSI|nr:vacuolar protein sorting-associated protein 45-like protein isoform X1 [Gossypium australe]